MGSLQFADLQTSPTEVLDLTSLTVDEFQRLVPPFEAAFEAHRADWRLDTSAWCLTRACSGGGTQPPHR